MVSMPVFSAISASCVGLCEPEAPVPTQQGSGPCPGHGQGLGPTYPTGLHLYGRMVSVLAFEFDVNLVAFSGLSEWLVLGWVAGRRGAGTLCRIAGMTLQGPQESLESPNTIGLPTVPPDPSRDSLGLLRAL
jgi:hypothetical protein